MTQPKCSIVTSHHKPINFISVFTDDTFLLQFMRTKKFRVDKATELFENYMLLKHSVPKWCDFNDETISRLWSMYENGVAYPLMERDDEGRRILFIQARKLDPKIFSLADAVHLMTWIAKVILEEEETQISGIVTIVDLSDISFGHLRLLSVSDVIDFVSVIKNGCVGRQKGMYLVSLPSFASFFLEVAKKATNEKLRKRIHLVDDMDAMKNIIGASRLPLELGGDVSEAEMMRNFRKLADQREDIVKSIQQGVDWDRVALDGENSSCSIM